MKYLLILIALIVTIGCTKSNQQPNPIVTPSPTPVASATPTPVPTSTPVVKGIWCATGEGDFSPSTPAFDTAEPCNQGERKAGGGTVWECKAACTLWINLEAVKTYAHQRSNILVVNMLDGSVQKFVPILPSPMPNVIPQMEVVEQPDHSFKLK